MIECERLHGTGIAAFAAIRVELRYLRRDVDHAHARLDRIEHAPKNGWNGHD